MESELGLYVSQIRDEDFGKLYDDFKIFKETSSKGNSDTKGKETDNQKNSKEDILKNEGFKKYLESELGLYVSQIRDEDIDKLYDDFKKFEKDNSNSEKDDDFLNIKQGKVAEGEKTNANSDLDTYYKNWCEKEHTPPYVYENTTKEGVHYSMDYYKTPEDKAAGKKAAAIEYTDQNNVVVEGEPDYEFLSAMARKAKLDEKKGIAFDEEMTPEFKAKLAAACVEHGLKMKDGPQFIDYKSFEQDLSPELKAKIDQFNNKYENILAQTKADKANGATEKDLSGITDKELQAKHFAACKEAGMAAKGSAAFYSLASEEIKNLPDTAKQQLKEHNGESMNRLYEAVKGRATEFKNANPDKEFDLSQSQAKDPKSAALLYAAYTAAGVKVSGIEEVNKDSQGMFQTETLGFMPKEARELISDYNYGIRKEQLEEKRKGRDYAYQEAIMAANPTKEQQETIARYEERRRTQEARSRIAMARQNGKEASTEDKARITGAGRREALSEMIQKMQQKTH